MGMVKYNGGKDNKNVVNIRNLALNRIEKLNADPVKKAELAQKAQIYINNESSKDDDSFKVVLEESWNEIAKLFDLDIPGKYSEFQKKETRNCFVYFFRSRMATLISQGWFPQEARKATIDEFRCIYGETSLVPNKLMFMPPELVYNWMSKETLQEKFKAVVKYILATYKKKKYSNYSYTLTEEMKIKYYNGYERGISPPNLAWNPETKSYNFYILTKDGIKLHFKTNYPGELFDFDFKSESGTGFSGLDWWSSRIDHEKDVIDEAEKHYDSVKYIIIELQYNIAYCWLITLIIILIYLISRYRIAVRLHNQTEQVPVTELKKNFRKGIIRNLFYMSLFTCHITMFFGCAELFSRGYDNFQWAICILAIDECLFLGYAGYTTLRKRGDKNCN